MLFITIVTSTNEEARYLIISLHICIKHCGQHMTGRQTHLPKGKIKRACEALIACSAKTHTYIRLFNNTLTQTYKQHSNRTTMQICMLSMLIFLM